MSRGGALLAVAGGVALVLGLALGRGRTTLGVLDAGFLFFAGVAAGGLAVSIAIRLALGGWAASLLAHAEAPFGFLLPALVPLALLVLMPHAWMPDLGRPSAPRAARDLAGAALLLLAGCAYLRRRSAALGIVYELLYVAVLSSWAVDLAMGLGPWAPSTVMPAVYFISVFVAGLCLATLRLVLAPDSDPAVRYDAGKLVFGFVSFWGYLLFAEFLPTWYENIPDETALIFARWHGPWRSLLLAVLGTVGAVPFGVLLTEWAKRQRVLLGIATASALSGVLLQCLVLVLPPLHLPGGVPDFVLGAVLLAGLAGLFATAAARA